MIGINIISVIGETKSPVHAPSNKKYERIKLTIKPNNPPKNDAVKEIKNI